MRFSCITLPFLLCCAVAAQGQGAHAKANAAVDFFLGEWDVKVLAEDSQVIGRARTEVRRILDGTAMQADYYGLGPDGNPAFRGTTIRTWSPQRGQFIVHWAMAGLPGYTYLEEKVVDGELHAEGHGVDAQGEFQERYRYFNISETTYSFQGERSYDDGKTWRPFAHLQAVKRGETTR